MMRGGVRSIIRGGTAQRGAYSPIPGVMFDGTNDHLLTSTFTPLGQSPHFMFRVSLLVNGGEGTNRVIFSDVNSKIVFEHDESDQLQFYCFDQSGENYLLFSSGNQYFTTGQWITVCCSVDTNREGPKLAHFTVNGVDDLGYVADFSGAFDIDQSAISWNIGSINYDQMLYRGGMAGLWIGLGQYLNVSDKYERLKFIEGNGKPKVDLGPDGSAPTGLAPEIYLNNEYASFEINKGTEGDLTVYGALTGADSGPTD